MRCFNDLSEIICCMHFSQNDGSQVSITKFVANLLRSTKLSKTSLPPPPPPHTHTHTQMEQVFTACTLSYIHGVDCVRYLTKQTKNRYCGSDFSKSFLLVFRGGSGSLPSSLWILVIRLGWFGCWLIQFPFNGGNIGSLCKSLLIAIACLSTTLLGSSPAGNCPCMGLLSSNAESFQYPFHDMPCVKVAYHRYHIQHEYNQSIDAYAQWIKMIMVDNFAFMCQSGNIK